MKKEEIEQLITEELEKYDKELPNEEYDTVAENIATEIVKLFAIPVVKARILEELKNKAKEADSEAARIGAADREGGFEKSGEATGLETAIGVVEQYMP